MRLSGAKSPRDQSPNAPIRQDAIIALAVVHVPFDLFGRILFLASHPCWSVGAALPGLRVRYQYRRRPEGLISATYRECANQCRIIQTNRGIRVPAAAAVKIF